MLNEEHSVFTGDGSGGDFRGVGEGGHDGGEDEVGALGGVDGRVQPPGAVVVDQRHRLPVVGLQARVKRLLVVVAAPHERLAGQLRGRSRGDGEEGESKKTERPGP